MMRMRGLTLMEMLITLTVISILAAIAYPNYSRYRMSTVRTEGINCLLDAQRRQEVLFTRNGRYSNQLSALELPADGICGDSRAYRISVVTPTGDCPLTRCYVFRATPFSPQDRDGRLDLSYDAAAEDPEDRLLRERFPPQRPAVAW